MRTFLLPLLGLALFVETAAAQTAPTTSSSSTTSTSATTTTTTTEQAAPAKAEKVSRKKTTKVRRTKVKKTVGQVGAPAANPWTNADLAAAGWTTAADARALRDAAPVAVAYHENVYAGPGQPLNQVGHGVTTDYDGRPLKSARTTAARATEADNFSITPR